VPSLPRWPRGTRCRRIGNRRHQHATHPEAAALDLLMRSAETATARTAFRAALQDLAGALHVDSPALVWGDAKLAAAAIAHDACMVDDCVRALRDRAGAGAGRPCVRARAGVAAGGSGVTGTADAPRYPLAVTRCSRSPRMVTGVVFGNIDLLSHLPKTWIS